MIDREMIIVVNRVQWPQPGIGEAKTPFVRGKGARTFRITFHASGLADLSTDEAKALEALRELSHLGDIDALTIDAGASPLPSEDTEAALSDGDIEPRSEPMAPPAGGTIELVDNPELRLIALAEAAAAIPMSPILIDHENGLIFHTCIPPEYGRRGRRGSRNTTRDAILRPDQWRDYALSLTGHADAEHPDVQTMYRDLLDAEVHRELRRDILVTTSPRLLNNRHRPLLRRTNPMRPSEAARLIGLFLRSRNNYAYTAHARGATRVNSGLFYRELAWHRLPHMWGYVGACMEAGDVRGDDTAELGQSVMSRAERALQARDDIGFQYYVPQDNDVRNTIMRHFDNLTLLLSGALDAQALIAYRAYNVVAQPAPKVRERDATFRNEGFQRALDAVGAKALHALVTGQRYKDVSLLVSTPRNTIHKAQLTMFAFEDRSQGAPEPQQSLVSVPHGEWAKIWDAAERRGGAGRWGLRPITHHIGPIQTIPGAFEPYAFTIALVEECFYLIDAVADATDVTGLFLSGHAAQKRAVEPPDDGFYNRATRERIDVLG